MFDSMRAIHVGMYMGSDLTALAVQQTLQAARMTIQPANAQRCHVLLVDDFTVIKVNKTEYPCILITHHRSPRPIQELLKSGIYGCLYLGDPLIDCLPQAVQEVTAGRVFLSPTLIDMLVRLETYTAQIEPRLTDYQRRVLNLTCQHWSVTRIALHLGRTKSSIYQTQYHLREIFQVETNGELSARAVELGFVLDKHPRSAKVENS